MRKIRLVPYNKYSKSCRAIRNALPNNTILKVSTNVVPSNAPLLNWGSNTFNFTGSTNVLNKPDAVKLAANKLTALNTMKLNDVRVPIFTQSKEEAKQWLEAGNKIVLCRTLLRSNSGKGIVVCKTPNELVDCSLYVRYVRKEKEYRLHIFNGRVIDAVEKRKKLNTTLTESNRYVRSHDNGWIMARENINVSDDVKTQAIKAVRSLGLDFGAVDIVVGSNDGLAYVLEVNTAPGLEGKTITSYANAIKEYYGI